ncbi:MULTISPECIES: TadE/TadG family type IV pilus assembly protein [unclassified Mesorhizobium]|uniref:TadE/TadG family type IV pilus assembly protein n=1 Tax=unclassified Mesorhizobium TaxID=325217 RepID=UPI00067F5CFA|nr:TadE/TadG family type IV pilus assembly protein [Mesorhizobium sp. L103C119B0]
MGDVLDEDSEREICKAKAGRVTFARLFLGDRRGSTAIEFAMLALPFAALVFAILESCVSFAGQEVMANITDDIARQLRTGQLRQANISGTQLRDKICGRLEIMVAKGCPGLQVDLREFTTFEAASTAGFKISGDHVELTGVANTSFQNKVGPSESRNMLRVFYPWPVMTDFMAKYMSNMANGKKTLHYASAVWQNEPFDD